QHLPPWRRPLAPASEARPQASSLARLVLRVEARRRLGLQPLVGDRPAAHFAHPVGALVEPPERVFDLSQFALDLLELPEVAFAVEQLGPDVGWVLAVGGLTAVLRIGFLEVPLLGADVRADLVEALALGAEELPRVGVVHPDHPTHP